MSNKGEDVHTPQFYQELKNIIDPHQDVDEGSSDDFIYGTYIEWPKISSLDEAILLELLYFFGVKIPFGTELSIDKFMRILTSEPNPKAIQMWHEIGSQLSFRTNAFHRLYIQIPDLTSIRDSIDSKLVAWGVPENTVYENGHEMDHYPNELKIWNDFDALDSPELREAIRLDELKAKLEALKKAISVATDPIMQKSSVLGAFVLTESFVVSKINEAVRDSLVGFVDTDLEEQLYRHLTAELWRPNNRAKVYKMFMGRDLLKPPHDWIRNIAAHDINAIEIFHDQLKYVGNKPKTQYEPVYIVTLFDDLIKHIEQL